VWNHRPTLSSGSLQSVVAIRGQPVAKVGAVDDEETDDLQNTPIRQGLIQGTGVPTGLLRLVTCLQGVFHHAGAIGTEWGRVPDTAAAVWEVATRDTETSALP
jgi:hypothetical protein